MSAWYNNALDHFPDGAIDWTADTIMATLVDNVYAMGPSDADLSAIGVHVLAGCVDQPLLTKGVGTPGIAGADSITFSGVTAGQTLQAIVLYKDHGGGVTELLAYIDTGAGLPFTTTGTDITVDWNSSPAHGTVFTVT